MFSVSSMEVETLRNMVVGYSIVIVDKDSEMIETGTKLRTTDETVTGGCVDMIVTGTLETTICVEVLTNVSGGSTMVTSEIDSTVTDLLTVVVARDGTSVVTVVVTTTVDPLSVVVNEETMISGIEVVKVETLS